MGPPSILLGNETNIPLFHLSLNLLGTEGHFLALFGKGRAERTREEVIATDEEETGSTK